MASRRYSTIQELARNAGSCFERGTRPDGESFTRVKDGSPEWVSELVREAHGDDFLPDDWRYEHVHSALEFIAEAEDAEDGRAEFADSAVDVYTGGLFSWLSSNMRRQSYVDEATEEFGPADSVADSIARGQYLEASEVYGLVLGFLEQRAEDVDEDEAARILAR